MTFAEYLSRRGAASELGRQIGVTHSAVLQWQHSGVPAVRVLDVERLTGISRHDLRPDIFGPSPDAAPTESVPDEQGSAA